MKMDPDFNKSTDQFGATPPINQSPVSPMQQAAQDQVAQPSIVGDLKRERASKRIKRCSIISLIVGCIVLIGYVLPYIFFGEENLAVVYMAYYMVYGPIFLCGMIVCVVLFFLTLINMAKYKIKFSKFVVMAIIGVLLAFSPLLYNGIRKLIRNSDPYVAKGMVSTGNGCKPFTSRAKYDTYANSNDIMCGYLEAFYKNGKEPEIQQDIISYINSSGVKNGDIKITIDGEQPKDQHHFNIVTRHSCDYYKGEDNSYVSVWFYESDGNMAYRCDAIRASDGSNIYDLEQSKEWFADQFDVEINSDEARKVIEDKRKEQGDDTWMTGVVEIAGKSKDGYYWVAYEEVKNDGTTTKLDALFHRENEIWIFETPKTDYDFNKHNFKNL
ncbi:hypothetical protein IKG60_00535 [Candidatus Saccharibacteria bacterium]|nr:hypothetical protein [Candidatus Saccharibacteria bacterium]